MELIRMAAVQPHRTAAKQTSGSVHSRQEQLHESVSSV